MAKQKIKNKCDTSINWAKATFIPKMDEIIVYSDLHEMKIGDGIHRINDLPFSSSTCQKTPLFEGIFKVLERDD